MYSLSIAHLLTKKEEHVSSAENTAGISGIWTWGAISSLSKWIIVPSQDCAVVFYIISSEALNCWVGNREQLRNYLLLTPPPLTACKNKISSPVYLLGIASFLFCSMFNVTQKKLNQCIFIILKSKLVVNSIKPLYCSLTLHVKSVGRRNTMLLLIMGYVIKRILNPV